MPHPPRHAALWAALAAERPSPQPDVAHDLGHLRRVHAWALRLAPEAGADPDLAGAAAILHDLVSVPKDHPDRSEAGARSAAAAAPLLARAGYSTEESGVVIRAIHSSSWSSGRAPEVAEGAVLQDADRLDALGAIGALRNAAVAQAMAARGAGTALAHPDDPFARGGRPLDDRRHALDHWPLKLFRLAAGMHTPGARAEAARRTARLQALWGWLDEELCASERPPSGGSAG